MNNPPHHFSTSIPPSLSYISSISSISSPNLQQQQQQQQQHTPYSIMSSPPLPQSQSSTPGVRPIDNFRFTAHQDQTTLVLGVLSYMERLENEISEMKEFVNLAFKRIESIGTHQAGVEGSVEEMRLQNRNWNRANVTELDEQFRTLPRFQGDYPGDIITTGDGLREASHKAIDHLLDLYDIPFVPTMFLVEKKMLYLRFLGANRVVMHRILD